MAAPADAGRVTTSNATSTSQAVNLPGSIASGDFLLVYIRANASTTFSWPAGWTEVEESSADASDDSWAIATRTADGTEGATVTVTLGTSRPIVAIAYRVTGTATLIAEMTGSVGSASQPNGAAHTIGSTPDTRDVLWLSIAGIDADKTLTSGPTGYSNATLQNSGGSGVACMGASKQVTADLTEDPGAWTLDSNGVWNHYTVAIFTQDTHARVTQLANEVVVEPDNAKARVTQLAVEGVVEPTNARARVTQLAVEVVVEIVPITAPPFQGYVID